MILDIVPIVEKMAPRLLHGAEASVACVSTTRPKYLVFRHGRDAFPVCVVERGESRRLTRTEHVLSTLSAALPGTVPAVISSGTASDGGFVLIQEGLPGVPWFRVADHMASESDWRRLLARSIDTLNALHAAIRAVPSWNGSVDLAVELARQATRATQNGVSLSATLWRRVREATEAKHRPLESWWQHGDFSLNNLLVDDAGLGIIDFDEFGRTMMPLHDAFGLALSFVLSQPRASVLSRSALISECITRSADGTQIDPALRPGLLLHHLLVRINDCHGSTRRAPLRRTLLDWAEQLSETPKGFLP